jgi:hypothetical protein
MWTGLVTTVVQVDLVEAEDQFVWNVNKNSVFSVKSMYTSLMLGKSVPEKCASWKLRVPLKTKIFLWYLKKGIILTKDNLIKRKWKGDRKCCFCNSDETIQHLFFDCHVAKFVWNAVYFTFGIDPPSSVTNMLGSCVKRVLSKA